MRWPLLLVLAAVVNAQPPMPIGIVRGTVVSRTATDLSVRNASGSTLACSYDAHTYFERDRNPISSAGLTAGDPVEVVADRQPGSPACYARTVQVVDPRRSRFLRVESATESFAPRGDMMFGGVVLSRGPSTLTLRTQSGDRVLLLRPDTRYWWDGVRASGDALAVNTRVFIRAGKDFDGRFEVYQAAWGLEIPIP